ncbi:MAG: hemolysin family protein [Anaerolineaceae bacterium]|jgi:putative hemolysin
MLLEILVIFLLILLNGFFSMSEISLVSARKIRLEQRAEEGDRGARDALKLTESANNYLSAVQVGITLIGVLTGAVGGATLAGKVSEAFKLIPWLAPYAYGVSLALVVLLTTYFSLVLGELIPKRLGMNNPEKVASSVAGIMRFVSWINTPVIKLLSWSTDMGLRLLGARKSEEPPITQDEIRVLMEQGTQVGVFNEAEQDMVEGVFRLNDRSIDALMTPRTSIEWLDLQDDPEEIFEQVLASGHSRFPVADSNLDNVIGIITTKDLYEQKLSGAPFDLKVLAQKPLIIPESTPASKTLEMVKAAGVHEALVIDEYGGLLGMVTLFDVLESIVGEIPSQDEEATSEVVRREDGSYLIDGLLPVDEFKELFDLDELPDEDKIGFQTVGGFVMNQIGAIPLPGQHFEYNNLRIEVVDMDGKRVDKILVNAQPGTIPAVDSPE